MMAAVAALFAFASCGGDPVEETPAKLSAPTISIKNVTTNGFTVSWKAVTGAKSYSVVLNTEKPVSTNETSYEFTNLAPGTYKVKVKAVAGTTQSPFSKEQSVNIEGATSADWFTLSLTALTESEELGNGVVANPWDALKVSMKGTGVAEMAYALFYTEEIANKSNVELIEMLEDVADQSLIDGINSAEGTGFTYYGIPGSTSCTFVAYVKNTEDEAALIKASATTAETQLGDNVKAWIGNWTAKTSETLEWVAGEDGGEIIKGEPQDMTFELTIDAYQGETLMIDGLSVWGKDYPTLADVVKTQDGVEVLAIWNNVALVEQAEEVLMWAALAEIYGHPQFTDGDITAVGGEYPAYMLVLNEDGTVDSHLYQGYLTEDGSATFTVYSYDVYWFTQAGSYGPHMDYVYDENGQPMVDENGEYLVREITVYRAGEILDMTKVAAAPSAQSKNIAAKKYVKSNLVANSIVYAI